MSRSKADVPKRRKSAIEAVRRPIDAVRGEQGIWPLQLLNFFMADMQAGIGPFLGVFLLAHGWRSGMIGTVMTIGGVAAMLMTAPAGALVDTTSAKRSFVIVPGICTVLASTIILFSQHFWLVAASQVATSIAGAAIAPAVTGITLGIVRQAGFNKQNGRNQAFNHAGNMVGAALSGYLGWKFGLTAVFWLAAAFGVLSVISVLMIPRGAINDGIARGLNDESENEEVSGFHVLANNRALLVLAGALACFHLGNGAMLPLYGVAAVATRQADPSTFVATTIVVAQAVMIAVALAATWLAEQRGYWFIMLVSFVALPIRGLVAAYFVGPWGIYPFQLLDGIAEGLQSVAVPALVARILKGTGRVNAGQGAVMTVQGFGGALSPALGGWIAEKLGYGPMFIILGSFALGSAVLWVVFREKVKPASISWSARSAAIKKERDEADARKAQADKASAEKGASEEAERQRG